MVDALLYVQVSFERLTWEKLKTFTAFVVGMGLGTGITACAFTGVF